MGYMHNDAMDIAIGTLGYGLLDSRIILQLEIYLYQWSFIIIVHTITAYIKRYTSYFAAMYVFG